MSANRVSLPSYSIPTEICPNKSNACYNGADNIIAKPYYMQVLAKLDAVGMSIAEDPLDGRDMLTYIEKKTNKPKKKHVRWYFLYNAVFKNHLQNN